MSNVRGICYFKCPRKFIQHEVLARMNLHATEIARHAEEILARIASVCTRCGRDPKDVTLVAVTKTHPVAAVQAAVAAGLLQFGENKAQELRDKAPLVVENAAHKSVIWHFIGHLQRNKAKDVVRYAHVFHALDDLKLAETLDRLCTSNGRTLTCLVQVNISGEDSKSGIEPSEIQTFLESVSAFSSLRIQGLMGIAHPDHAPEHVRPEFRMLREQRDLAIAAGLLPGDAWLSMGMSDDLDVAIEEGATHIRVGTAIFGSRA